MFALYALRTIDVDTALRFYEDAIGLALPRGRSDGSSLEAWPLHEQARARGAPPHWLGHIAVDDVDEAAERLVANGAERLGPTVRAGDVVFAALRDPWGAVVAVRAGAPAKHPPVAWHQLHTRDAERAWALYAELFDWTDAGILDTADVEGGHRRFTCGDAKGSIANTARWPGVHPHWLFYFPVADVEAAAARVRTLGGVALSPITLPDGTTLAACEDPQGAAFGILRPA